MAVKPMLENVESIRRGRVYGSVFVVFYSKKLSYELYKTTEINFISLYMGRRMGHIGVQKIAKREDPLRVVVAILKPINNRIEVM